MNRMGMDRLLSSVLCVCLTFHHRSFILNQTPTKHQHNTTQIQWDAHSLYGSPIEVRFSIGLVFGAILCER